MVAQGCKLVQIKVRSTTLTAERDGWLWARLWSGSSGTQGLEKWLHLPCTAARPKPAYTREDEAASPLPAGLLPHFTRMARSTFSTLALRGEPVTSR